MTSRAPWTGTYGCWEYAARSSVLDVSRWLRGTQKINARPTGAPDWFTAAAGQPGSADLCFIADEDAQTIGAHPHACGVEIIAGPVTKVGALGPITSPCCRDPDGNLIEVATYGGAG